ncbi:hypothetical protein F751_3473 [Auxenochlorella protothecoides]|uniref:Uncharacterized protein n=1 Tax=Auxenochlorella protothecoides TaxID=3075 RepID=A0A087SC28_AUXPR|nr:hypothetical protein F751_3473 [Auxenochlorella protothecoides]KFM23282.1 hypothetical protein F751_3473 [Auxenochlorella protothecoides]RMZ53452.1 hypothetical protein APUTEX25_003274 [Auxenochlorella protothecoides]|eukprot:RMZ53452.1 hypothetical protein APUTEX25_003274 [Auxenochlorella protothecoides]
MEERLRAQVPTVAAAFRDSCQLASDSLFEAPGFAMPATPRDGQHPGQYIKYSQVESFLAMAEQALRARDRAVDALRDETAALMSDLDNVRGEKSKVEVAESVAVEEAQQLSSLVQQLHAEKAAMQAAMQKLQRESQYLTDENALLRNQLTMAMNEQASGDMDQNVSPLGPHTALIAHLTDTLSVEQDRATQVDNENMLLRARVAALEKAGLAQQSALVSCIEEGERSLLASGRRASLSPQAVLSPSHWRSENTEEDGAGSEAESSSGGGGGFSTPVARRLGTGFGPLSPRASLQAQAS